MTILQTINHKKNEQGIIEFTNSFESEHLYLEKLDAEVLFELSMQVNNNTVLIPSPCTISGTTLHYIRECWQDSCPDSSFIFLDDITPNLSKYIPEDNAVLFLSEESLLQNRDTTYPREHCYMQGDVLQYITVGSHACKKFTIFLHHGTQSEIHKAEEVAKELKEKYGVEEVNLLTKHLFGSEYQENSFEIEYLCEDFGILSNINKIITTNSTGTSLVQNEERLQVIDCKEIFDEYLKENN